jgi:hypothetical protein
MDEMTVNPPEYLAWAPFNREAVTCFRCIKPEVDIGWGTPVPVVERGSVVTWIVEDIDQKAIWSIPCDLDIYLLAWRIAVKKKAGDHARHI